MKKGIHPEYAVARVTCACGNSFETRSTKAEIILDICGACHPFYTGSEKVVDTTGRIEKFNKKFGKQK
jgi:large subunit ribosomal protein L31